MPLAVTAVKMKDSAANPTGRIVGDEEVIGASAPAGNRFKWRNIAIALKPPQ
jgi:hypothetical protein